MDFLSNIGALPVRVSGSTMALTGLYVDPRGQSIAVGQWGTILRY